MYGRFICIIIEATHKFYFFNYQAVYKSLCIQLLHKHFKKIPGSKEGNEVAGFFVFSQ